MENFRSALVVASVLFTAFAAVGFADGTEGGGTPTQVKKATRVMLSNCRKEFPDTVKGKSLDEIDQWAEAQENSPPAISTDFKKSQCFATHEVWEKLTQKNEWAVANQLKNSNRVPASAPAANTPAVNTPTDSH